MPSTLIDFHDATSAISCWAHRNPRVSYHNVNLTHKHVDGPRLLEAQFGLFVDGVDIVHRIAVALSAGPVDTDKIRSACVEVVAEFDRVVSALPSPVVAGV